MIDSITRAVKSYANEIDFVHSKRFFIFSSLTSLRLDQRTQESLIKALVKSFPHSAFYFPAFTYNNRRLEKYTDEEFPSPQNGSLTRVVFESNFHQGFRTLDEDYSYLVVGSKNLSEEAKKRERIWRSKSFGLGSHHAALFLEPAIFLAVGKGLRDGFTPAMHLEALNNVKYRRFIDIPSQVSAGETKEYYARKEDLFQDFGKGGRENLVFEFQRNSNTSFRRFNLTDKADMYAFTLDEFFQVGNLALSQNNDFFLS